MQVQWIGLENKTGTIYGPRYVSQHDEFSVEMRVSPLPICPKCCDTKGVFNPYKGPFPSRWGCKTCGNEWGFATCQN